MVEGGGAYAHFAGEEGRLVVLSAERLHFAFHADDVGADVVGEAVVGEEFKVACGYFGFPGSGPGGFDVEACVGDDFSFWVFAVHPVGHGVEGHVESGFEGHFLELPEVADNLSPLDVFVFQLDGDDGASVLVEESFYLLVDFPIPFSDIFEVEGMVGAGFEMRVSDEPVRQSAVSDSALQ